MYGASKRRVRVTAECMSEQLEAGVAIHCPEAPGSNGFEGDQEMGLDRLNLGDLADIQVEMSNQIHGLMFRENTRLNKNLGVYFSISGFLGNL